MIQKILPMTRLTGQGVTKQETSEEPPSTIHQQLGSKLVSALDVLYQAANRFTLSWEIGFSGGKDSTVLCHLIFEYVKQAKADGSPLPPKIYIIYLDTLLDLPLLRRHTLLTLKAMKQYAERFNGLIEVKVLKPAPEQDYFTLLIEKGYPAPHYRFRWCVDRLKIDPTLDFLGKLGNFIMITGVRQDESTTRRRNMAKRQQTEPITIIDDVPVVAPLLYWSQQDVWNFLLAFRQPWSGERYDQLFEIYRLGDNLEGCSGKCSMTPNSRFGCWTCTVVRRDRLLHNLASWSEKYRLILEAKERIRKISLTPTFREIDQNGKYRRLNLQGRYEVIRVLAELLLTADEALEGYLEDPVLRVKLIKWLRNVYAVDKSPLISEALSKLGALS